MPFPEIAISEDIIRTLQTAATLFAAYFVAVWMSLVVWTFMDVRSRTNDLFIQAFGVLLVLGLNFPGLLLYFLLRPQETLAEQYRRSLEEEAILQDMEKLDACPGCKRAVREAYLICPYCTMRLKQTCKQCAQPLGLNWKACPYCTTQVEAPQLAAAPAAQLLPVDSADNLVRPATQTVVRSD